MKRSLLLSVTILALALPLAASADTWTPGENFMTNWDQNEDGQVTADEVLQRRGDLFDSFDANEDGILQPDELADHNAMRDAMREANRPDADERGGWSRVTGWVRGHFHGRGGHEGMMGGRPGYGPMQQRGWGPGQAPMGPQGGWGPGQAPMGPQGGWGPGYAPMGPQGYGYGPGMGRPGMMGQPGFGPQGMGRPGMMGQPGFGPQGMGRPGMMGQQGFAEHQMEQRLDANGDGQISRDEFVNAGKDWIARFDRNGDGKVTLEDFGQPQRTQPNK